MEKWKNENRTEDLNYEGLDEFGNPVYAASNEKVQDVREIVPEIKELVVSISPDKFGLGDIIFLEKRIAYLVGQGINEHSIISAIEDTVVDAYQKSISSIDNSSSGVELKESMKEHLVRMGVNKDKL